MNANAYEILSLAMRYVFAALMVLIVLRGWRITIIDSRRSAKLRRLSPETGIIGQMLVVDGSERARTGMKYSLTLEGTIGSSRRADIRIRHSSVKGRHAYYQMTDEGLFIRGHARSRIALDGQPLTQELMLCDGDVIRVGRVKLMLVLIGGGSTPEEIRRSVRRKRRRDAEIPEESFDDGVFDLEQDDGFFEPPVSYPFDEFDEFDEFEHTDRRGRRLK